MTTLTHPAPAPRPRPTRDVFLRRRRACLWAPAYTAGIALILTSFTLTATINGATILGTLLALTALAVAVLDERLTGDRP